MDELQHDAIQGVQGVEGKRSHSNHKVNTEHPRTRDTSVQIKSKGLKRKGVAIYPMHRLGYTPAWLVRNLNDGIGSTL